MKTLLKKTTALLCSFLLMLETYAAGIDFGKVWKRSQLKVCYDQNDGKYPNENQRGRTRFAVSETWQYYSKLKFNGFAECTPADKISNTSDSQFAQSADIRIRHDGGSLDDSRSRSVSGTDSKVTYPSMHLKYDFFAITDKQIENVLYGVVATDLESTVVHEFGHALSFRHEQQRSDTPSTCKNALDESDSNNQPSSMTYIGTYDPYSIMNYCLYKDSDDKSTGEVSRSMFGLSNGDVFALQMIYGKGEKAYADAPDFDPSKKTKDGMAPAAQKIYINPNGEIFLLGKDGKLYSKKSKKDLVYTMVNAGPFTDMSGSDFSITLSQKNGDIVRIDTASPQTLIPIISAGLLAGRGAKLPLKKIIAKNANEYMIIDANGTLFIGNNNYLYNPCHYSANSPLCKDKAIDAVYVNSLDSILYVSASGQIKSYNANTESTFDAHPQGKKFVQIFNVNGFVFAKDEDGKVWKMTMLDNRGQWDEWPTLAGATSITMDEHGNIAMTNEQGEVFTIGPNHEDCRIHEYDRSKHSEALNDFAESQDNDDLKRLTKVATDVDFVEEDAYRYTLIGLFALYVGMIAIFVGPMSIMPGCPGILLIIIAGLAAMLGEILAKTLIKEPATITTACVQNLSPEAKQRQAALVALDYQKFYLYRYLMTAAQYTILWALFLEATIENLSPVEAAICNGPIPALGTAEMRAVLSTGIMVMLTLMIVRIITYLPMQIELRKKWESDVNNNYGTETDTESGTESSKGSTALLHLLRQNLLFTEAVAANIQQRLYELKPQAVIKMGKLSHGPEFCLDQNRKLDQSCLCRYNDSCYNPGEELAKSFAASKRESFIPSKLAPLPTRINRYTYLLAHPEEINIKEQIAENLGRLDEVEVFLKEKAAAGETVLNGKNPSDFSFFKLGKMLGSEIKNNLNNPQAEKMRQGQELIKNLGLTLAPEFTKRESSPSSSNPPPSSISTVFDLGKSTDPVLTKANHKLRELASLAEKKHNPQAQKQAGIVGKIFGNTINHDQEQSLFELISKRYQKFHP